MSAKTVIRSRQNPLIKRAVSVLGGRGEGSIALEGDRLLEDALSCGVGIELILVADTRHGHADELEARGLPVHRVDAELMGKISSLKSSPGLLALCPEPARVEIADWSFDARSLLLVAVGIADPGNLGALARSAEAFGAQALIVTGGVSPWNPRALRGSMGSLLRLQVALEADTERVASELSKRGLRQALATTRGGVDPLRYDWSGPLALWISGERGDIPEAARAFDTISIPMGGRIESLNVTVATSLLLYASGRVRLGEEGNG